MFLNWTGEVGITKKKLMSDSTNGFQNQRSLGILMQIHLVLQISFQCHLSILFDLVFVSETVLFSFLLFKTIRVFDYI